MLKKYTSIAEIKQDMDAGKDVYWSNMGYTCVKDKIGQYLIICTSNQYTIGLTNLKGDRLNGNLNDFFCMESPRTNRQRAEYAAYALDQYGINKEGKADYDAPEEMAVDLITDLLHLIRAHELHDPLDLLEKAKLHFQEEEFDHRLTQKP